MVTGDAVNAAARLQTAAEPGELLASERTVARCAWIRRRGSRLVRAEGQAGAACARSWCSKNQVGPTRGLPGFHAPMVGRDTELDLLQSVYERAARERRPHLVTIYGEAGVGKSRLSREFLEWSSSRETAPIVLRGRCLPYGDGITYWPLAEILKSARGHPRHRPARPRAREGPQVGRDLLTLEAPPTPRARRRRSPTRSAWRTPTSPFADLDPRDVRAEVHAAWRSFFSALGATRTGGRRGRGHPLGGPRAARPAGGARRAGRRGRCCSCVRRGPSSPRRRPGWGGGRRNMSSRRAGPAGAERGRAAGRAAARRRRPARRRCTHRILERAEGNPFFLEEIVRRLIDERR